MLQVLEGVPFVGPIQLNGRMLVAQGLAQLLKRVRATRRRYGQIDTPSS
jgi:hypothetical protein